ncbi:MAG: BlaI/MecI/CopY family transcriptional regulator [Phycisphaerales bacterium]
MATTKTRNFGTTFKSAVNRGTAPFTAVQNIASKNRTTESVVWNNLFSNGYVSRRKVNGSYIYWPTFNNTRKATSKTNNWFNNFTFQNVISWAIANNYCTPEQVDSLKTQKDFYNFFGPFLAQQFNWTINSGWNMSKVNSFGKKNTTATKRSTTRKSNARKSSTRKSTSSTGYQFPRTGTSSSTRSRTYSRAA